MFTGIVQGIAKLVSIKEKSNYSQYIMILPEYMLLGLEQGASIANNGCCLTVTKINGNQITFDLIKETLKITNLGKLVIGDLVNVERSAKLCDEIGGHLMSGHIITTAKIIQLAENKNNFQIWFQINKKYLMKYFFYKGFIGIDGISLTIGEIMQTCFCVYLIPETIQRTTLIKKKLGHLVNIEIDTQTQTTVDTVERILAFNNYSSK